MGNFVVLLQDNSTIIAVTLFVHSYIFIYLQTSNDLKFLPLHNSFEHALTREGT